MTKYEVSMEELRKARDFDNGIISAWVAVYLCLYPELTIDDLCLVSKREDDSTGQKSIYWIERKKEK